MRRVVCAAVKLGPYVVLGARHYDMTMRVHINQIGEDWDELKSRLHEEKQGFIDQHGEFMSRCEAWNVAKAAGQIIKEVGGNDLNGGTLYSENLY